MSHGVIPQRAENDIRLLNAGLIRHLCVNAGASVLFVHAVSFDDPPDGLETRKQDSTTRV